MDKFYTPLNLKRCVSAAGVPFVGVTIQGRFFSPDEEITLTQTNKKVFHFRMTVQNREKYIGDICGLTPTVNEENLAWARVSCFDKLAERFVNFMQKHPNAIVTITGAMQVKEWTPKGSNVPQMGINITADDFMFARDVAVSQDGGQKAQGGYTPAAAPQQSQAQPPQQQTQGWGHQGGTTQPTQQTQGWGQHSSAPAPAPAPQQAPYAAPQPDRQGFVDLGDEDGELPF